MTTPTRSLAAALLLLLVSVAGGAPATQAADRVLTVTEPEIDLERATPEQAEMLKQFMPKDRTFDVRLRHGPSNDRWQFYRVEFPSPVKSPWAENNVVSGELYLPTKIDGPLSAAVVLDIMDGSAVVPRGLARGLAQNGVAAIYIPMACYGARRPADGAHHKYFADHPEKTPDNLRQTVMDIRRAKAVLAALPEIDGKRIAITGVSLGGIMTSLAAGVDGTFWRVVPILAGGDLAAICFHDARETRRIRQACEAKGIDQAKLAEILKPVEPLTFASRINPAQCLMINALRDEVIPPTTTDALRKAIGMPQMLTIPVGHYGAILFLPNIRQRTIDFIIGKKVTTLDFTAPESE